MTLAQRQQAVEEALSRIQAMDESDDIAKWIQRLQSYYPNDIGVLSPLFLNLVVLEPGQAMFLPAARLHSYLEGAGIEIMGNSDNVLRCGLTTKHVDASQLTQILQFEPSAPDILNPVPVNAYESRYLIPCKEFALSILTVKENDHGTPIRAASPEILLCIEGSLNISNSREEIQIQVDSGMAVYISPIAETYWIQGQGVAYRATVPI
jgi:mannose-6-phosphate isomerase